MFRFAFAFIVLVGLAGCSSAPVKSPNPFEPYTLKSPEQAAYSGKKIYRLGSVKVKLDQSKVNEKFPDEEGLQQIFTAMLTEKLERGGYLAPTGQEGIELNFDINYKRTYMGEAFGFSKGFAGSTFSYNSDLKCGEQVCASYTSPTLIVNGGLFGNLAKIGKQLSLTGSPEDELSEIAVYVNEMAANIPR